MSDHDDAMAALEGLTPIGNDHPDVVEMGETLQQMFAQRARSQPAAAISDVSAGVARPGDTLVVCCPGPITAQQAAMVRTQLMDQLPGVVDVVIVPAAAITIYRGGTP